MTSDRRRSWRLDLATAALSSAIGLGPRGQASHQPSTRTCAPSFGNLQLAMRYHRVANTESEALCTACRDSRIFISPPICVYTDSLRVRLRTGLPSVGWTSHGQNLQQPPNQSKLCGIAMDLRSRTIRRLQALGQGP